MDEHQWDDIQYTKLSNISWGLTQLRQTLVSIIIVISCMDTHMHIQNYLIIQFQTEKSEILMKHYVHFCIFLADIWYVCIIIYYPYKVYKQSKKSDMKNVCWILNTEIRSIALKKIKMTYFNAFSTH